MLKVRFYFLLFLSSFLFLGCSNTNKVPLYERECVFCDQKVLNGRAFYEDNLVIGLLTHKPATPGHALIIPKRHVCRFEDLTSEEIISIGKFIKKVHQVISKIYGTSSYLLLQKNGEEAGQTVPHVHFHYIPRKIGAGSPTLFFLTYVLSSLKNPMSVETMSEQISKIKDEFINLDLAVA